MISHQEGGENDIWVGGKTKSSSRVLGKEVEKARERQVEGKQRGEKEEPEGGWRGI